MAGDSAELPPGIDLFTIPLQPPPKGVVSDFSQPSDLRNGTIIVCVIMLFCEFTLLASRICTKLGRDEKWKMDDWLAIITVVLTTTLAGVLLTLVPKIGKQSWNVSIGSTTSPWAQKMIVCEAFLTVICLFTGKMCLLALLYHFFWHINRVRYQIWISLVLCLPLLSMAIVVPLQSGPPPGKPWGTIPKDSASQINDKAKLAVGVGVVNFLVDLLIFYIPIPVVLSLNLDQRKKLGVLAIFLTGSIAIIANAVVMVYRLKLFHNPSDARAGQIVPLCSFVEAGISVTCSSMPSLAKLYKAHILPSSLVTRLRARSSSSNSKDTPFGDMPRIEKAELRKVKGPYSIPTTRDCTGIYASRPDDLELLTVPEGYEKPVSTVETSKIRHDVEAGCIQKKVSWDQESYVRDAGSSHPSLA